MDSIPATGGLLSPEVATDWTLASVGAPTENPAACTLPTEWMVASMQGKMGCCAGCTGEEAVREIVYLLTGVECNPGTPNELSWRFVYALCKCLEGTLQPDGTDYRMFPRTAGANDGTYMALVAKVIRKYGVSLAKYCPNDVTLTPDTFCYFRSLANIPANAIRDADTRKSGADLTEPVSIEGIKTAINYAKANKGAVAILRRIGDTYWVDANGVVTYDKKRLLPIRVPKAIVSGHAELLTGYDTEPGTGRIRFYWLNHWSPQWCSTNGTSDDGGRGWEYADVWLPNVIEVRVILPALPPAPETFKYNFTKQLARGMSGPDVVALQHVLQIEGCFPENQAFTGYYGDITFNGVVKLQEKYASAILAPSGLAHGTGNVGPSTLTWLRNKYSTIPN